MGEDNRPGPQTIDDAVGTGPVLELIHIMTVTYATFNDLSELILHEYSD